MSRMMSGQCFEKYHLAMTGIINASQDFKLKLEQITVTILQGPKKGYNESANNDKGYQGLFHLISYSELQQ